jgi:hypothetical protein
MEGDMISEVIEAEDWVTSPYLTQVKCSLKHIPISSEADYKPLSNPGEVLLEA